ncbi:MULTISPECIES: hypothetical protein [Amycolatopsis]|uniref:Uncharacterized protein n=1 Tax=Amycolatopsis albidoflavus TaxID=102226 RepID=A0ABW5HWQ5_9PSEU
MTRPVVYLNHVNSATFVDDQSDYYTRAIAELARIALTQEESTQALIQFAAKHADPLRQDKEETSRNPQLPPRETRRPDPSDHRRNDLLTAATELLPQRTISSRPNHATTGAGFDDRSPPPDGHRPRSVIAQPQRYIPICRTGGTARQEGDMYEVSDAVHGNTDKHLCGGAVFQFDA